MNENVIRNCTVRFRRVCPQTWDSLRPTGDSTTRFCDSCQHEVFLCATDSEAVGHATQGHCIAKPMPTRSSLGPIVLGRPEVPPPHDQGILRAEYDLEGRKTRALRDVEYSSRLCPQCGYPCADWFASCYVCGYHVGRLESR